MSNKKKVKLNGKEVTLEELKEKIEECKDQKGIKIREISPGVYRIKIEG